MGLGVRWKTSAPWEGARSGSQGLRPSDPEDALGPLGQIRMGSQGESPGRSHVTQADPATHTRTLTGARFRNHRRPPPPRATFWHFPPSPQAVSLSFGHFQRNDQRDTEAAQRLNGSCGQRDRHLLLPPRRPWPTLARGQSGATRAWTPSGRVGLPPGAEGGRAGRRGRRQPTSSPAPGALLAQNWALSE